MRYGRGVVFLSRDDYDIDWASLKFVISDEAYPTEYRGTIVLDIGAHKGYYGAYALERGARTVISFEPESTNCEFLERSADAYRRRGADWRVRRVAVGAERGSAELHVMGASWGHALHPPAKFAEFEVGIEHVLVEAMADVLEEAVSLCASDSRLVVKVNTEGEECGIVLGTPSEDWRSASEVFIEMHPWADCSTAALAEHLYSAGLREAPSPIEAVIRLRRAEESRSGLHKGSR